MGVSLPVPGPKTTVLENEPLISVIMPVYQGEGVIGRAVRSVLNQTYRNIEVIVVDDGSRDGTLAVLKAIQDPRLTVLPQANQGAAAARNLGITHAQGEYLAFLDSDDVWFPTKLQWEIATIRQHGQPECMVYSWYYAVDEDNRLLNFSPPYRVAGNIFEEVLRQESILLPSTTLVHRNVFQKVGLFPTDRYHEDRTFFIKACQMFPAFPTEERLVIYQQSLSGKCRRVLKDFDLAMEAEHSITKALDALLTKQELAELAEMQTKSLFYRFLMYGFMDSARRLYPQINHAGLLKDKKGLLALASMKTGLNLLIFTRVVVQWMTRNLLAPWWRSQSRFVTQLR